MPVAWQEPRQQREMKVLALGLPRSGSASLTEALTILGYKDVFHGNHSLNRPDIWDFFDRAADASYPNLPTYTGREFTRQDWDELYGPCEGTTEAGAAFAPQMIKTYPDAKVILTIREFDQWYKSIDESFFKVLWSIPAQFAMYVLEPLAGTKGTMACRKLLLGLFQAGSEQEVRRNARATYDRHHAQIQEMVPPGQLLIYNLGDGWEPLCEFLGKPVPEADYPWTNSTAEFKVKISKQILGFAMNAAKAVMPWVLGAGAAVVASRYYCVTALCTEQ